MDIQIMNQQLRQRLRQSAKSLVEQDVEAHFLLLRRLSHSSMVFGVLKNALTKGETALPLWLTSVDNAHNPTNPKLSTEGLVPFWLEASGYDYLTCIKKSREDWIVHVKEYLDGSYLNHFEVVLLYGLEIESRLGWQIIYKSNQEKSGISKYEITYKYEVEDWNIYPRVEIQSELKQDGEEAKSSSVKLEFLISKGEELIESDWDAKSSDNCTKLSPHNFLGLPEGGWQLFSATHLDGLNEEYFGTIEIFRDVIDSNLIF